MTALQDLLVEVGDQARRVDPGRLAAQAMISATRRRRVAGFAVTGGTAAAAGLVVAVARLSGVAKVTITSSPAAGANPQIYAPYLHEWTRYPLAAAFAVAAGSLVGWRDRSEGSRVPRLERTLAALWGASLALWAFGAVQLAHAVLKGLHLFGHPYVTLVSAGAVPLLAVGVLVNGSPTARRLVVLALAAQAVVTVSLLYGIGASRVLGGKGGLSIALTLAQAGLALLAVVAMTWQGRSEATGSPAWQLAALWSAGVVVLLGMFGPFGNAGTGMTYHTDAYGNVVGVGTGLTVHAVSYGAGTLAALLVGLCLWRARDRAAGLALVSGLMVAVLAGFSLTLYGNAYPRIGNGWGPYLGFWWLAGLPVLGWLAVHRIVVKRRLSREE